MQVGCVLQDSVADNCGLRTRDYLWKVAGVEVRNSDCDMSPHLGNRGQVFDKTHSQCVALMRQCGDRLQVTEYSTVQYSTVQYSTVQYSTVCTGGRGGVQRAGQLQLARPGQYSAAM